MEGKVNVSVWQREIQHEGNEPELGAACHLFKASIKTVSSLLHVLATDLGHRDAELYQCLRDEFRKFYMWNEAFSTGTGGLDCLLDCSKNLKGTVLELLVQWAKTVSKVPDILSRFDWSSVLSTISELQVLAGKVNQIAKATNSDRRLQYSLLNNLNLTDNDDAEAGSGSDSDDEFLLNEYTFDDIIEDLNTYTESLADLSPSLEHPAGDHIFIDDVKDSHHDEFSNVSQSARPFASIIRDRFPSLEAALVKKLGECNWRRRERLRIKLGSASHTAEMPTANPYLRIPEDRQTIVSNVHSNLTRTFQSVTISKYSDQSIFDHMSVNIPSAQRPESVTSFATSAGEEKRSGQRRIPSLPDNHEYGSPFRCQICGDIVVGVQHRADWKKHVYKDLEPYVCLFTDCELGLYSFRSRQDWMKHEFQVHRVGIEWHCTLCRQTFESPDMFRSHIETSHRNEMTTTQIEEFVSTSKRLVPAKVENEPCPFCLTTPSTTQLGFVSHVGKHQQEISLAASPILNDDSDDGESIDGHRDDSDVGESIDNGPLSMDFPLTNKEDERNGGLSDIRVLAQMLSAAEVEKFMEPRDNVIFPVRMIPRSKNEDFFGRVDELKNINRHLDHDAFKLHTYTLHGPRGVGKTVIALQYASTNPARFDAVFWVQCETALSLRQSFTNMAMELNLPGASRNGHDEENHLAVLVWLNTTRRRWLLVFDNAESEYILRGYWPVGGRGSILITSRKHCKFINDAKSEGNGVKPFNEEESWGYLMKLLGPEWEDMDKNSKILESEETAAREFLRSLGGLSLAIQHAAELIKNPRIGDRTIRSTYQQFKDHKAQLPERHTGTHSDIIKALDTVWDMTFKYLSPNALNLLSVLALLSPDGILIDIFMPKNQRALDGKLEFCKQSPDNADPDSQASLSSVMTPAVQFRDAIDELVKSKLITEEGRELVVHRVVQEAVNHYPKGDLQTSFDSANALVYEAFPKQVHGDYLSSHYAACQAYISHGALLSRQFERHNVGTEQTLKGSRNFIDLLYNCAWYLYEISDYDICLRVAETARSACEDTESLHYASICNAAGGAYFEINKLVQCREQWETFFRIQNKLLVSEDSQLELSSSYHNMGNLEYASDNLTEAIEYFNRAIEIRTRAGDSAANLLANSYLCLSRVHFQYKDYETAFKVLGMAEALIIRTSGAGAPFMAHVHYTYGNIEFAQKRWTKARRAYDAALKVALATAPIHPITISVYYRLGCVEFEQRNADHAKNYLDKAMSIAQLRSPHRDDGTMARILWKASVVLDDEIGVGFRDEANEMRLRAEMARNILTKNGEGGVVTDNDEEGNVKGAKEELYDALVPGFFR